MTGNSENILRFSGSMSIVNVTVLLKAGQEFLFSQKGKGEIIFNLSEVEEVDSSALCVLFSLLRSAQELGIKTRITHPPSSMISLAQLYGVSDALPFV